VCLLALAVAHLPVSTSFVLDQVSRWLRTSAGVELSASRLRYNLLTLSVSLDDVRLAATATPGDPFATASRIEADFGWRTFLGQLDLRRLALDSPSVAVRREPDGSGNLPDAGSGNGSPGSPSFTVPDISVEDLAVDVTLPGFAVSVRNAAADLTSPSTGVIDFAVRATRGLSVTTGETTITADTAAAQARYDGRSISIAEFSATRPGTSVTASGTIDIAGDDPQMAIEFRGSTELASWTGDAADAAELAGQIEGSGRLTGSRSSPLVSAELTGADLAWATVHAVSATARGTFSDGVLEVDTLTAAMAGGQVSGEGRVELVDGAGRSVVNARWSNLNLARLFASESLKPDVSSSGTAALEWQSVTDGPQASATASMRLASDGADASLQVRASGRGATWRIDVESADGDPDELRAGADLEIAVDAWTDSRIAGTASLATPDAQRVLRRLDALGVPFGGFDVSTVSGTAVVGATLGGTLGALEIAGDLDGQSVVFAGSPEGELTTTMAFDLGAGTWSGTYEIALADIAPWADAERPELALRGGIGASGSWSGPLADPVATVVLSGGDLSIAGVAIAELAADGRVSRTSIEVDRFTLRDTEGGRLQANGRIDPSTGFLSLTVNGSGLSSLVAGRSEADPPVAEFSGASVTAVVDGVLAELQGRATIAVESARVQEAELGAVDATIAFTSGRAAIQARVANLATSVEGTIDLSSPYAFDGRLTTDGAEILQVLAAAGVTLPHPEDLAGSVTASVDVRGSLDDLPATAATVVVTPEDVLFFGMPVRTAEEMRVTIRGSRLRADSLTVLVGDVSVQIDADLAMDRPDGSVGITLDGQLDSLATWFERLSGSPDWTVDGRVTGQLDVSRSDDGLSMTGTIESAVSSLSHSGDVVAEDLQATLDVDGSRVHLRRLAGSVYSGETEITASAPLTWLDEWLPDTLHVVPSSSDEPAVLEGTTTFDAAAAFAEAGITLQQELAGRLTVTARLQADAPALDALTGDVTFDRGEMATLNRTFAQFRPTVLRLADRRLTIESLDWRGTSGDVTGSGVIGLAPDVDTSVNLVFDTNLRVIDTFLPGRATGVFRGTLDISGHTGDWQIATEATLERANWLLPEYRVFLADWTGQFQLSDDALVVSRLEGQLNGGTITVAGRLPLGPGGEGDGLTIAAREVLLDIPKGLHSQAVADLRWTPRNDGSVLGGSITLTANRYREPVTRMLEMVDALASSSRASAERGFLPEWLASSALDIELTVTDPVILDNSLGTVEFVPNLRLTGTLGDPALDGEIGVLDDGRINIGGRTYRLRESRLRFVPSEGLAPTLDVTGETRVGDYDVVLRITGTPDQIETTASSSPPLSERDLRSLLVTGQVESGASTSDDFALAAASTDILGFAGKFVGLDSVRIGAADLDIVSKDAKTAQHLTISKSFGRMFELILSENLEDGPLTWVVVWKPISGYEFRFASVENTQQTIEFRQELLFGPGTSRARSSGSRLSRATPQPTVANVEITGSPGFSENELRGVLRLKPGQRFDIRKWIDDRLRLEKFYRDRDYHRARIVPTRIELDPIDGARRLSLRYDLDRGPRTVIEVVGDDLPGDALDEMRENWGGVPIADVLREEFERIAGLELSRRGYLRAGVSAEFTTVTDELEQAKLTVDRGPRTRHQLIAWSGNRAITAAELNALAAELPAELSPFIEPSSIESAVARQYAELGFFSTEVHAGSPAFAGDRATLPIEVVEGPQSHVSSLTFSGVAPDRIEAARAAVALPDGAVFGSRTAVEAHRRLEGFYADLGYRDAKVAYSVDQSPEGPVSISMTVDEGLPHVISDVSVSGVESTNQSLVDRAVTLEPGQEAGRQRALDTRRNLYDIGTFRQADVTFEPSALAEPGLTIPVLASVVVEEPKKYQLRYGVQLSSNYTPATGFGQTSFGFTTEIRDRNFLGRAMQASLGARYDSEIQTISLLLSVPRTFGRSIRTNVYARERWETTRGEVIDLQDQRRELTLEQRWRVHQGIEMAWSYGFGFRRFRLVLGDQKATLDKGYLAGPALSVVFDRRDNPFDATSGWFHSSSYQLGVEWLGSSLGYGRYLGRQTYYVSFGPITLAAGGRWGSLDAYSGDAPLSALDLFFTAGGTNTVRGYPEGGLSAYTLETETEPFRLGGPELLVLNGEVRYPIYGWFKGVVFVDAGNTFLGWRDVSASKMAVGGGLGIRVHTPLAPLRFDFAYPLTTGFGYRGLRIHFSIGQMF